MATKIPWTQETWNPVTGCTKIRAGCKNCYAERMTQRFWKQWHCQAPPWHFAVTSHHNRLEQPLQWKKPRMIFVCSMGDLFHKAVPFEFIAKVWDTMFDASWHTYQILTKRPQRMLEFAAWMNDHEFRKVAYENLWLGVSVSNQKDADEMIPVALQIPAAVRFVSVEPLLGEIDLTDVHPQIGLSQDVLTDFSADTARWNTRYYPKHAKEPLVDDPRIDWLIIGCERLAGNKAGRFLPCFSQETRSPISLHESESHWWAAAKSIVEQAQAADVPVFFKQGPVNGKVSDNPDDWPEWARVQEKAR